MFIYVVFRLHNTFIDCDHNHYNDNNYRDDEDDNIDQRGPVESVDLDVVCQIRINNNKQR